MWAELMDELHEIHLGLKPKHRTGPSVGATRLPDERRGTSSLTHAQKRQLSSWSMIRKSGLPRDISGTRLRGDHAQTERWDRDAIPSNRIMIS
jgi:hypothetical protein